jgi:vancomycin resistance protein VanW
MEEMKRLNPSRRSGIARPALLGSLAGLGLIIALAVWAMTRSAPEREIGSYVTSLKGRTPSQVHNVILATRRINNVVLQPGQVFSFNRTVGTWTADRGYRKAPVSYDGELVRSWGGGVCQASTTLYNAALLAGLDIVERHRHHWPARYAPVGRDAAVAYSDIDLKVRNSLSSPVRIVGSIVGNSLVYRILSSHRPPYTVSLETQVRSVIRPTEVIQDRTADGEGRWKLINRGHPGFSVATYRRFVSASGSRRELVSEDRYPAMNRVVRIAER